MRLLDRKVYRFDGIDGIKKLYGVIVEAWKPKDTYYIVSAPLQSFTKLESFFLNTVHAKRIRDRVILKMIINKDAENFGLVRKSMPFTQVKFLDTQTTAEYGILNDLLFIVNYENEPYGILIKDASLAGTFKSYFELMWKQGRTIKIPPMIKTTVPVETIIRKHQSKNPMVVTDPFNFQKLKKLPISVICVRNNNISNVERIKRLMKVNNHRVVIGVGGCTALDAARASATEQIPSILIPTVLSTVCISVNKSVFNVRGEVKTFNTESPHEIVLSIPAIMNTERNEMIRWATAGFGDLFAKIGAAIDVVYRETKKSGDVLSLDKVRRMIPEVFDAIDYVFEQFSGYDKKDMEALAIFLHEAAISIIIRDTFELSGGAEHNLAYVIEQSFLKRRGKKTEHGVIVSVGTLIETRIFGEITGDHSLYKKMRRIYVILGLPTTYRQLRPLGVTKANLTKGIRAIRSLNTMLSAHSTQAIRSLDDIFNGEYI